MYWDQGLVELGSVDSLLADLACMKTKKNEFRT